MLVFGMLMVAAAIFVADLAAVVAIVASLWLERSLGIRHGFILDLVFIIAISYGVGAWAAGKWMQREMRSWRAREQAHAHHDPHAHPAH